MHITNEEIQQALSATREVLDQMAPLDRGSLIPVLQKVQLKLGYIPPEAMQAVAEHMEIPTVDVYSVVTFYNQFRLTPPGKNQVKVCMGTACHMRGGHNILESWERRLEINVGETTPDREFSLERVACVGCCTMAPVVLFNETVHSKVTPTKVDGLLFSHNLAREQQQKEGDKQ